MIEAILLSLQPTTSPTLSQQTSEHVASVRYDCSIVDETGNNLSLKLLKSGRMTIVGDYDGRQETSTDVSFMEPEYRIMEGSDSRFAAMHEFLAKPRQIGWQIFVRTLDERGDFSALFQLIRHKLSTGIDPNTGALSGLSMIMYMPRVGAPEQTETLGGVCLAIRLEDQSQ